MQSGVHTETVRRSGLIIVVFLSEHDEDEDETAGVRWDAGWYAIQEEVRVLHDFAVVDPE